MATSAVSILKPNQLLKLRNIIPVDATWFLPNIPRTGYEEFTKERLPGSVFFDVDKISAKSPYPHMLPSKSQFEDAVGKLGINQNDPIAVYDKQGNFSAPRVAFTFSYFGHQRVYLLDNFPEYKMQGLPLDTQPISTDGTFSQRSPTSYRSRNPAEETVVSFEELKSIVTDSNLAKKHVILEARPEGRWKGTDPEPRAGLSSGHVPGSVCLPFNEVLTEGNTFKSAEDVKELLEKKGVDINADQEYIVMCGSGVTACVVKTALEQVLDPGKTIKVYDGSWTEWAQRADNSLIVKE